MRTQVASTSIATYRSIKRDGTVSVRQAQILAAMKPGRDYTLQELVKLTGLPVNVVSGRCNEMRKDGALAPADKRNCSVTGNRVTTVKLPSAQGSLL